MRKFGRRDLLVRPRARRFLAGIIVGTVGISVAISTAAASPSAGVPTVGSKCGQYPGPAPLDPDGVVAKLPALQKAGFVGYPITVHKSPYATLAAVKKPWKIGFMPGTLGNTFAVSAYHAVLKDFANLKKAGAVTGSLMASYQSAIATQTAAAQLAGYQQLVSEGANLIIIEPLSGPAMANAVTAAGKKGVVTVTYTSNIPSVYAINLYNNPYLVAAQMAAGIATEMGGKGSLLMVRGIPLLPIDQQEYAASISTLKQCPGIKIVGTVDGEYTPGTAKSAVLQFLASHPATINGALQLNVMSAGVIEAFIQTGRAVPPVSDPVAQIGTLAYWAQHKSTFHSIGTLGDGGSQADAALRIGIRVLAGNRPKMTDVAVNPPIITAANLSQYVTKGASLTTPGEATGVPGTYVPNSYLDPFFAKPGPGVSIPLYN